MSFAEMTMPIQSRPSKPTPLERIVGFEVAEEIYDTLEITEQLIIDLRIEGWSQHEIGQALGLSQGWVSILFKRARHKLVGSKLQHTLEVRQHMRETMTVVTGDSPDNFSSENERNY